MRRLHVSALAAGLLLMILASACSSAPAVVEPTAAAPIGAAASPTAAPPTVAPPTVAPATVAPAATAAPPTAAPPTAAPATAAPATAAPATAAPATAAPATTAAPPTAAPAATAAPPTATAAPPTAALAADVVIYASDLQQSALTDELTFWDDPVSPGGKMIGLPNTGDKLNAPPEDDPHITFSAQVQGGIPYRGWIHMKVGTPKGVSQANRFYVQFSDALDKANQPVFTQGTGSYMTAQGPQQAGWIWVRCESSDADAPDSLLYFRGGKVTVRMQAGMEGVGFDQFLLSPERFLDQPPAEAIVQK
jgi:hypothetical protein